MPLVGKKFNGNLFLCNKCDFFREEADFLENPSLTRTCPFCGKKHGGQLTNTGKSYEEWEAILEQQPDAPPKNRLGCTPFDSVLAFAHKQVIAPMGTFDQKIVDEINEQIEESKKLHCPRCFSTNVETDGGGVEYGSDGIGSTGPGWDLGNGLVATRNDRGICKNCGYMWPL